MGKKLIWILISIFILVSLTGCSKDEFLSYYDSLIGRLGRVQLTSPLFLKGNKRSTSDGYRGEYMAKYKNFNGREYLFGGTNIDLGGKEEVVLECDLHVEKGFGKLGYVSGSKEEKIILNKNGKKRIKIKLYPGANYLYFEGDNCDGNLEIYVK